MKQVFACLIWLFLSSVSGLHTYTSKENISTHSIRNNVFFLYATPTWETVRIFNNFCRRNGNNVKLVISASMDEYNKFVSSEDLVGNIGGVKGSTFQKPSRSLEQDMSYLPNIFRPPFRKPPGFISIRTNFGREKLGQRYHSEGISVPVSTQRDFQYMCMESAGSMSKLFWVAETLDVKVYWISVPKNKIKLIREKGRILGNEFVTQLMPSLHKIDWYTFSLGNSQNFDDATTKNTETNSVIRLMDMVTVLLSALYLPENNPGKKDDDDDNDTWIKYQMYAPRTIGVHGASFKEAFPNEGEAFQYYSNNSLVKVDSHSNIYRNGYHHYKFNENKDWERDLLKLMSNARNPAFNNVMAYTDPLLNGIDDIIANYYASKLSKNFWPVISYNAIDGKALPDSYSRKGKEESVFIINAAPNWETKQAFDNFCESHENVKLMISANLDLYRQVLKRTGLNNDVSRLPKNFLPPFRKPPGFNSIRTNLGMQGEWSGNRGFSIPASAQDFKAMSEEVAKVYWYILFAAFKNNIEVFWMSLPAEPLEFDLRKVPKNSVEAQRHHARIKLGTALPETARFKQVKKLQAPNLLTPAEAAAKLQQGKETEEIIKKREIERKAELERADGMKKFMDSTLKSHGKLKMQWPSESVDRLYRKSAVGKRRYLAIRKMKEAEKKAEIDRDAVEVLHANALGERLRPMLEKINWETYSLGHVKSFTAGLKNFTFDKKTHLSDMVNVFLFSQYFKDENAWVPHKFEGMKSKIAEGKFSSDHTRFEKEENILYFSNEDIEPYTGKGYKHYVFKTSHPGWEERLELLASGNFPKVFHNAVIYDDPLVRDIDDIAAADVLRHLSYDCKHILSYNAVDGQPTVFAPDPDNDLT